MARAAPSLVVEEGCGRPSRVSGETRVTSQHSVSPDCFAHDPYPRPLEWLGSPGEEAGAGAGSIVITVNIDRGAAAGSMGPTSTPTRASTGVGRQSPSSFTTVASVPVCRQRGAAHRLSNAAAVAC